MNIADISYLSYTQTEDEIQIHLYELCMLILHLYNLLGPDPCNNFRLIKSCIGREVNLNVELGEDVFGDCEGMCFLLCLEAHFNLPVPEIGFGAELEFGGEYTALGNGSRPLLDNVGLTVLN